MTTAELEKRLTAVEQELADLRARVLIPPSSPNHWVEKIAARYSTPDDKAAFDEAMRLGRKWRNAQRPSGPKRRASKK